MDATTLTSLRNLADGLTYAEQVEVANWLVNDRDIQQYEVFPDFECNCMDDHECEETQCGCGQYLTCPACDPPENACPKCGDGVDLRCMHCDPLKEDEQIKQPDARKSAFSS